MNRRLSMFTLIISAVLMLALSLPALAAGKGTVEDPYVWRMAGMYARGISYGRLYETFAQDVKRLSGGRMVIEVMYDNEGINTAEVLNAVRTGLIEVANPLQSMHAGEFPAGVVDLGLPDGPKNEAELRALYEEGGWLETMREAYGSIGCYYLGELLYPATWLLTKEPINTLEDIKRMKIRCPGAYGEKIAKLGGSPVTMSLSEVYSSLASGLLDGVDGCTMVEHYESKTYEMAKYAYPLPVANSQSCGIVVNLEAYNKLSDDLKAILIAATQMSAIDTSIKAVVWGKEAENKMFANGLKWGPQPSEEDVKKWEAAGRAVWDDYAKKDAFSKKLLEQQSVFMKTLGYDF
ncbi:TRAP transporter substrate-binding protein DctP [Deltaproteobacteria bacterium OttesenSCG-928-M10]|nr:TRAP transporter substrate-binding protein DctP [Deltaproteobacteria bacterium OttesenSCG-928-M10]